MSGIGLWTRRSEFGDKVGILGLRRVAAELTAEVTCSALHEGAPAPPRTPGDGISCATKPSCLSAPPEGEEAVGGRRLQGGGERRERERKEEDQAKGDINKDEGEGGNCNQTRTQTKAWSGSMLIHMPPTSPCVHTRKIIPKYTHWGTRERGNQDWEISFGVLPLF